MIISGDETTARLIARRGFVLAGGGFPASAQWRAAQLPAPVGSLRDDESPAQDFENQKAFTPWTSAWNVTGMPAVSLPLHHTSTGLPVGVMLAGRTGEDHRLLALAAQVEEASPWRHRTPPCW